MRLNLYVLANFAKICVPLLWYYALPGERGYIKWETTASAWFYFKLQYEFAINLVGWPNRHFIPPINQTFTVTVYLSLCCEIRLVVVSGETGIKSPSHNCVMYQGDPAVPLWRASWDSFCFPFIFLLTSVSSSCSFSNKTSDVSKSTSICEAEQRQKLWQGASSKTNVLQSILTLRGRV